MARLDAVVSAHTDFAKDAVPVSDYPMEMVGLILGSSPRTAMTGLVGIGRCVHAGV